MVTTSERVLERAEVMRLISQLSDTDQLVAALMYASGLRAADLLQLRMRDIGADCLYLHDKWGMLRRLVTLPPAVGVPLILHLDIQRELYATDRAAGVVVPVPNGLIEGSDPAMSWRWRYMFPALELVRTENGEAQRRHVTPPAFRSAFGRAARAAALPARVTPQALRDAHAAHEMELAVQVAHNSRPIGRVPKVSGLAERRAAEQTLATLDEIGLALVRSLHRAQGDSVLPDGRLP